MSSIFNPLRWIKREQPADFEQSLLDFESIGYDCEFGLVQRYCGLEPLGLFRFTSAVIPHLVDALDTGLAEYGSDGDLEIFEGGHDHAFCRSRRYAFCYNTGSLISDPDPDALLRREYKKVRYLKERFLEDLAAGEKIFVRNGTDDFAEIETLVRALRGHGPATVLWINAGAGADEIGRVRWRGDGIMEGMMDKSALFQSSGQVPLEHWTELCRNASRLVRGLGSETFPDASPPKPADYSKGLPSAPASHAVASDDGVVASRVARHLEAGAMHVFSAWIWLPADFEGTRLGADFLPIRFGYREADLSKRECWQRVWASCKPRKRDVEIELRLVARAANGQRFWSADWRLEAGPLPTKRPPPEPLVQGRPAAPAHEP